MQQGRTTGIGARKKPATETMFSDGLLGYLIEKRLREIPFASAATLAQVVAQFQEEVFVLRNCRPGHLASVGMAPEVLDSTEL